MYLDFIPSTVNAEINAKIRYCVSEINMNTTPFPDDVGVI
jgi:hypothetical protein